MSDITGSVGQNGDNVEADVRIVQQLLNRQDLAPLLRLVAIENKVRELLTADPDDSLFCLFQALADSSIGYCAKHALLCATICELAGQKLGLNKVQREAVLTSALTMNIGMSREQDILAAQDHEATPEQRKLIKEHPILSHEILEKSGMADEDVLDIVRWHHERIDGLGYPDGLAGEQIPLAVRIVTVADAYEAMVSTRPYSPARTHADALAQLVFHAGTQFDARCVELVAGFVPARSLAAV